MSVPEEDHTSPGEITSGSAHTSHSSLWRIPDDRSEWTVGTADASVGVPQRHPGCNGTVVSSWYFYVLFSGNQNRKLLEQLEEQKKRLRMQTASGGSSGSPLTGSVLAYDNGSGTK